MAGKKDITKLVKKQVTDKHGKTRIVWVNAGIQQKERKNEKDVIDIYEYLIGGYNVPYKKMEKEVRKFLNKENMNIKEAMKYVKEAKGDESKEMKLTGRSDY